MQKKKIRKINIYVHIHMDDNINYQTQSSTISVSLFFIELNLKDPNLAVTFKSSFDMIKINFATFDIVSKCREFSAHTLKREFLSFSYIGHVIIK